MEFGFIIDTLTGYLKDSPHNRVAAEDAIREELAGMRFYDEPLFAVASAADPLFESMREEGIVGLDMLLPTDWLSDAKSVISFFLPFSKTVRYANSQKPDIASDEWFHARIEGQMMMDRFGLKLVELLSEAGYEAVYPAKDDRFYWTTSHSSNWSERHVAYICGLGTFGLSKGLITKKGVTGRFGSVVTNAELPVTPREYSDPFEYCTMCAACAMNCPAHAIDPEKGVVYGKDHAACKQFLDATEQPPHGPNRRVRYGCGKCQVGVPCEEGIPGR